jgi:hypothetical protein
MYINNHHTEYNLKEDRHCAYSTTFRHICVTTVAMEKQYYIV